MMAVPLRRLLPGTSDLDGDGRIDANELLKLCKKEVPVPNYDELLRACRENTSNEGATMENFLGVETIARCLFFITSD